jgi:hypothetical protein
MTNNPLPEEYRELDFEDNSLQDLERLLHPSISSITFIWIKSKALLISVLANVVMLLMLTVVMMHIFNYRNITPSVTISSANSIVHVGKWDL